MIEEETMDGGAGATEGDEDDENNRPVRPNPFLQPPILKALFEVLPLKDLAKCRLVSKLWNEESLSTWRSKATIKFKEHGIVSTRDDCSRRVTSVGEFLDLWVMGEWGSCPVQKFDIRLWDFGLEDMELKRFLELAGNHVTSLTLVDCSFIGRGIFRRILFQAFPNLQFLKMDNCEARGRAPKKKTLAYKEPTFGVHGLKSLHISDCQLGRGSMMDILSHFHKIKSLQLKRFGVGYLYLLEVIRLIRAQDQSKLPLNFFDVDFNLYLDDRGSITSFMELLRLHERLNLRLQRLKIHVNPEEDEDMACNFNDAIRDILQHHSSILKTLLLMGRGVYGLCKSFPFGICLENLEHLTIESLCFADNLNFLRATPNLRKLVIRFSEPLTLPESDNLFSNSSQLEIGDWTLPTLKELGFGSPLPLSLCNLRKLMTWMPNLKGLYSMELDDVKFSMICKHWQNLKVLQDAGEELTDEGVVGIGNAHEADSGDDEETQNGPNITKLKNLTYFATMSPHLTSASVHEGFLKLANLDKIFFGEDTEIDDEGYAALERRNITIALDPTRFI